MRPRRVIIVGGGIGGLSAAIALTRVGSDVLVLEQASSIDPVGGGITLFANAMRALDRLGLRESVAARGAAVRESSVVDSDGAEIARVPPDLLDGMTAVHRSDLQAVLAQAAGGLRLGVEVTSVEQDEDGVCVRSSNGIAEYGDAAIGADGIHSVVRHAIADVEPRYAGFAAWRGVSTFGIEGGRLTEFWGVGERYGLVNIGGGKTYWYATKSAPEGGADEPQGRKAEVGRRFSTWHPQIAATLDATDGQAIARNDVYDLGPLPRWSKGRITLLGDAAHAMTPGLGQGSAQSIEDAVVLAAELARGGEVPRAFDRYEAARKPRVRSIQKKSRRTDRIGQLDSPLACLLRNAAVRHLPSSFKRRQLEPLIRYDP